MWFYWLQWCEGLPKSDKIFSNNSILSYAVTIYSAVSVEVTEYKIVFSLWQQFYALQWLKLDITALCILNVPLSCDCLNI